MHEGKIKASNRSDGKNGAEIELQLPRQSQTEDYLIEINLIVKRFLYGTRL